MIGVSPSRVGGMEILVREICVQLDTRGWRTVLAWEGPAAPAVEEYFRGAGEVEFRVYPAQAGLRASHIRRLGTLLSETRPDVFVYAFYGILRLFAWQVRLQTHARIIYYDHSSKPIGYVPAPAIFWKRWLGRVLNFPIEKVTAVAEFTARCLSAQGFYPRSSIVAVHNGVETERKPEPGAGRAFREKYGIPGGRILVMQVCWLVPEKGVEFLLHAAQRVVETGAAVHFAIAGDGPKATEYRKVSKDLGLADRVTFTGPIMNPTSEGAFEATDITCQLSQWEEACPLAVLEGMAAGKPLVASRVGGIPELVEDGATGILVDRRSVSEAAAAILRLVHDEGLRTRMGEAGGERTRREFDLKRQVSHLLDAWGV
jgi:glycosyltransferase involved in cell wall biosynthesis